jgi:hypothetical protein
MLNDRRKQMSDTDFISEMKNVGFNEDRDDRKSSLISN